MQSQKQQNDFGSFPRQIIQQVIQVYASITNAKEAEVERFYEDLQDLLVLTPKSLLGIGIQVGIQEIPGVTGKFGPGVQNETG